MRTNEKTVELKISAVDFIITPLTITFKQVEAHQYAVEFDKGTSPLTQAHRYSRNSMNRYG
jgi:hypothetical protein